MGIWQGDFTIELSWRAGWCWSIILGSTSETEATFGEPQIVLEIEGRQTLWGGFRTRYMLYSVYAELTVCSTRYSVYTVIGECHTWHTIYPVNAVLDDSCTWWMNYLVCAALCVGCIWNILYLVYAVLGACWIHCMLYSMHAVLDVCYPCWMLYSVYVVLGECCTRSMLYLVFAVLSVCCSCAPLVNLGWIDKERWLNFVFCDDGRVVDKKERDGDDNENNVEITRGYRNAGVRLAWLGRKTHYLPYWGW